jgi:hypothetical protein
MRKFLREIRTKDGHTGFVFIPEGKSEGHGENGVQFEINAPKLETYKSGNNNTSRRCVLDCAVSGLRHVGLLSLAFRLSEKGKDVSKTANPMQYVGNFFANHMNREERKKLEYVSLNHKKLKSWNTLLSPKDYVVCVLGIKSSDGKTDHAICIANGWIFDATFERALVLSAESMDICSSSNECATKFVGVTRGHLLRARVCK